MRRIKLLLTALSIGFILIGCGPNAVEKRAQQVAQAKDDALKVRQQLAQAKTGAEAETLRQQLVKGLTDNGLTLESIHFTDAELNNYVTAAKALEKPSPEPKPAKAARQPKGKHAKKKGR